MSSIVIGLMQTFFLREVVLFFFVFFVPDRMALVTGFLFLNGKSLFGGLESGSSDMVVGLGGGEISGERRGEDRPQTGGSDSERQGDVSIFASAGGSFLDPRVFGRAS